MKRLLILPVIALSVVALATGASAKDSQVSPQVVQCTIYVPASGASCQAMDTFGPQTYFWAASSNWYQSSSQARRLRAATAIWGDCLPSNARLEVRLHLGGGVYFGKTIVTAWGSCGMELSNVPQTSQYTWIQCRINASGGTVYRHISCGSEWY